MNQHSTNCINDGNYQKYSCIINSSHLTQPNLKIDVTEEKDPQMDIEEITQTPRLKRLRKNTATDIAEHNQPPRKKNKRIVEASDDDADECGNLDGFVVYDLRPHQLVKYGELDENDEIDENGEVDAKEPHISTVDEEYDHFVSGLKSSEKKQLKKLESELATYMQNNARPLKYQILTSSADFNTKLLMMEKFKQLSVYDKTSSEYAYELTTLNQLLKIPWGKYVNLPVNIDDDSQVVQNYLLEVMTFLESVTHGQSKAKSTLLLELSRYLENPSSQGFILGVKGPPGSGKTTLISQGLAKILNRPFFRIDLGGAKHSDSLFGTRKVFDRSDIGDLVKILINARCMNPIILFDELDKVSTSEYGHELLNALNDLTDTNRNQSIMDQYLGITLDLSKVIIVFAYNSSDHIPDTLRSRIHEIEIEPYTLQDKIIITNKFFIPRSCSKLNFDPSSIKFLDDAITSIVTNYTYMEEGVRELERRVDEIILKINWLKLTQNKTHQELSDCYCKDMSSIQLTNPFVINKKVVNKLLKN
jgi:ATP-dependent Lon protease